VRISDAGELYTGNGRLLEAMDTYHLSEGDYPYQGKIGDYSPARAGTKHLRGQYYRLVTVSFFLQYVKELFFYFIVYRTFLYLSIM
jgi:hypothetical protein